MTEYRKHHASIWLRHLMNMNEGKFVRRMYKSRNGERCQGFSSKMYEWTGSEERELAAKGSKVLRRGESQ